MLKRNLLILTTLTLALGLAGCVDDGGDGDEVEVVRIVDGTDEGFQESNLTIDAGTTVRWRNMDSQPHTSTADDGEWDSGNLDPGDTFEFTFDEPGEYPYHCQYHGPQTGSITVTEGDDASE